MAEERKPARRHLPILTWLGAAGAVALSSAAVVGYVRTPDLDAAPGARLYNHAVEEALNGLRKRDDRRDPAAARQRPPLPAGLSPADHDWCEKCKTYHKRQTTPAEPGAVAHPGAAAHAGTPAPAAAAARPAAARRPSPPPPLPAGLAPDEFYWCDHCKAYHKRAKSEDPHASRPGPRAIVPYRLGMAPGDDPTATPPPPLPQGLSAEDYFWCGECKAYHKRRAPVQ